MGGGVVRCSGGCWHRAFCLLPSHRVTGRQEEEDRRWWWESRRRSSWTSMWKSRRRRWWTSTWKGRRWRRRKPGCMWTSKQLCPVVTNVVG